MKRLFGVLRIAVRLHADAGLGIIRTAAFVCILSVEAIRARGCNRQVALTAAGRALRTHLEHLGATFIKLGQVASTRPDLMPPEIIEQLVRLQEEVPPFPYEQVRRIIEEDFGAPAGAAGSASSSSRPLAAASVAQVHRARAAEGGAAVAVKVRRPTIAAWAQLDESIALGLPICCSCFQRCTCFRRYSAVSQFCTAVTKQLDFRIEAANNLRFRDNFKIEPAVVFPELVEPLCSERVLTMDLLEGVRDTALARRGSIRPRLRRWASKSFAR